MKLIPLTKGYNIIDAAKAADKLLREFHGEFATLNFPEEK